MESEKKSPKWIEYAINFVVMIIGIYIGFAVSNWKERNDELDLLRKEITTFYRECDLNMGDANEINEILSKEFETSYLFPQLSTTSAAKFINNPNARSIVDEELYRMMIGYLQSCGNVNRITSTLENLVIHDGNESDIQVMRQNVRNYNAWLLATAYLIRKDIEKKFSIDNSLFETMVQIHDKTDSLRQIYLSGKNNLVEPRDVE